MRHCSVVIPRGIVGLPKASQLMLLNPYVLKTLLAPLVFIILNHLSSDRKTLGVTNNQWTVVGIGMNHDQLQTVVRRTTHPLLYYTC